ncbi:LPXTG cell wall anchor domain-containing protein [Epidermidibacterium keratini]|uniref:LPXTG cell wall anchor domain-containing protein n=1 Tax=Epidermidibacterium keratini TaxID=1891644 RepID=A0A7L4YQ34_9ACTN|nr:LPXTG cell wall anchor domain-containing protein [Epidermidibacterium keratini]QHC01385.1 LPXTG cell wall anchor domain-containing protein [Epidermidibacterium keratini]
MRRRLVGSLFAAGIATAIIPATSAYADPPADLSAPSVAYYNYTVDVPDSDPAEGFSVSGTGCIGTEGTTTGTVTLTVTDAAGQTWSGTAPTADDGSWQANISADDVASGTATVAASCDIYQSTVSYPPSSVQVPAALPDLSAVLSADGSTIMIVGAGCISAAGAPGEVNLVGTLQDGTQVDTTFTAGADGSWSVSYPANLGNYEFAAVCTTTDWESAYEPIAFEVYDTATGPSTHPSGGSGTTVPASTGTGGSKATGPQLAATGADTDGLGWLAGGLVASGAAALYAGRRRKTS